MLLDLAFAPAAFLLQESPGITPLIFGIIAVLLIALFIWLLIRGQKEEKPGGTQTDEKLADQEATDQAVSNAAAGETDATETDKENMAVVSASKAEPELAVETVAPVEPPATVQQEIALQPDAGVNEPVVSVADNLELIEGIGPKISGVLNNAGVTTFAQLAEMDPERIGEILHAANLRLADPKSWPEQARLAAAGDQAGLQALQERLKGGREV